MSIDKNIEQELESIRYVITKVDGKKVGWNILNRIYGLMGAGLATFATISLPYLAPIGVPLAIEGLTDLLTGKHHFISYRVFKMHPKYDLEELLNQQKTPNSDCI